MAMNTDIGRTNIYLEFLTILGALGIPERRIMAKKMAENPRKSVKIPENPNKSAPRLVRWFKDPPMAMNADIVRTYLFGSFDHFGALGIPERRIMARNG